MFNSTVFLRQIMRYNTNRKGWETLIRLSMMGRFWFSPMRSFNMTLGEAKELRHQLDEHIRQLENGVNG